MALLLLTSPPLGHVAMSFKPGQIGPIRNAGGPTGDGRASVAGPCGGVGTFGSNGKGIAVDGETVTLKTAQARCAKAHPDGIAMHVCPTNESGRRRAAPNFWLQALVFHRQGFATQVAPLLGFPTCAMLRLLHSALPGRLPSILGNLTLCRWPEQRIKKRGDAE